MNESDALSSTRNIGIMAHIDAGRQLLPSVFCFTPDIASNGRGPRRKYRHGLDDSGAGAGITITSAATLLLERIIVST